MVWNTESTPEEEKKKNKMSFGGIIHMLKTIHQPPTTPCPQPATATNRQSARKKKERKGKVPQLKRKRRIHRTHQQARKVSKSPYLTTRPWPSTQLIYQQDFSSQLETHSSSSAILGVRNQIPDIGSCPSSLSLTSRRKIFQRARCSAHTWRGRVGFDGRRLFGHDGHFLFGRTLLL